MKRTVLMAAAMGCTCLAGGNADAAMRITEWMYNGVEFVEFTNTGNAPIDMTGWSYSDDSRLPGAVDLSAFGIVQAGESVILAEDIADDFRLLWDLDSSVKVIGENKVNLGRNDEINLFDDQGDLVDRLAYGDQVFDGTIRTQGPKSGITAPENYGLNDVTLWFFAEDGDAFGSWVSSAGYIGSPGYAAVPEPATLSLVATAGILAFRRRRAG